MKENKQIIPDEIISPDCDIDRSHKNIPIETIIEYRNRGLSYTEIAKLTGCSRQNVQQRLETVEYSKEDIENFKKHRGDVFAFLQSKLLNSIDSDAIKGMQPYQRIVGASILFDKERLELGKSTGNINILEVTATIDDLQRQADELRKQL
jgi:predicted DNA-binding protein YlxM (UPF0122 family)